MFSRTIRVGTRRSPLALKQVDEIIASLRAFNGVETLRATSLPEDRYDIVGIDTHGDKDKITPISDIEGTDFFTKEIEEALLKGEIDFAVHSAKDLPDTIPEGLRIAAITKSIDPYDALVSKNNLKLDELPKGARIGASSQRRKTQLKKYREDFNIVDVRGNIEERLGLLDRVYSCHCEARSAEAISSVMGDCFVGLPSARPPRNDEVGAIIIAACALMRLGLENRITQRIPFEILTPHPLQGALAIEVRRGDSDLIEFLSRIDSREKINI